MKKKRIISILIFVLVIAVMIGITVWMIKPVARLADNPQQLKEAIQSMGVTGAIPFMLLLILQVFAAIVPGGPFEIAAGYAFGVIPGTLICDIAMTVGGILTFMLTRKFGMSFVRLFFSDEQISEIKILKTTKKSRLIFFIIFLIPGTPKDIMSYLLGLTDLPLKDWIFISFVGRLPAILLSVISGRALSEQRYGIFIGVIAVIALLTAIGMYWYNKKNKEDES